MNFPTRYNNILDIFLTNHPSLTNYCNSIPGISDHEAILTESNISVILHKPPSRKIFLWNRADPELVRIFFNRFSNQFLNTYSKDTPINHLWSEFKNACLNCLNNLIPSKISSAKFHQPWITNQCYKTSQ